MMLMFVFVIIGVVVILRRTTAMFVSASATAMAAALFTVSTMSMTEHMHAHKKDDDQYEEPVFSYPFHCVYLICLLINFSQCLYMGFCCSFFLRVNLFFHIPADPFSTPQNLPGLFRPVHSTGRNDPNVSLAGWLFFAATKGPL